MGVWDGGPVWEFGIWEFVMGVWDGVAGSASVSESRLPDGGITRGENKFITRVIHDIDEYDERSNIHGKDI